MPALLVLLVGCGGLLGCGGGELRGERGGLNRQTQATLPKLGEYMVPLDDGRIQVAPPAGWEIGPRKADYVIWFRKSRDSAYPCILVSAEDFEGPSGVREANVAQFAGEVREHLEDAGKTAKGLSPLVVDAFAGVTYRSVGKTKQKFNTILLDRVFVSTAVSGRLYTFELRTPRDLLSATESAVVAVAAGAKFPKSKGETASDPVPPNERAAAEEGAAEKTPVKEAASAKTPPEKVSAKETQPPKKKPVPKKKPAEEDSEFELLEDDEF